MWAGGVIQGLSFVATLLLESANLVLPHSSSFVTAANYLTSELRFLKIRMMSVLQGTCALRCACNPSLGAGRKC